MKSGHVDAAGNAAKHAGAVMAKAYVLASRGRWARTYAPLAAFPVNPPANTFKAGPAGQ